ncbi:hypothetical protein [Sphingomonas sp.]|jgi:hypothetical protein|uniref:hypothetical protein n=1 Tax=Sphingomonas sp. TaxID=28214 RepID=UPI0035C86BEC
MRGPWWYKSLVIVFTLWAIMGVYACVQQFRLGEDAMGPASDYDRALFTGLPVWYMADYAVATGCALLGGLALLAGSLMAIPLLTVSLVAVMIQFGWLFATSDIIAVKGVWVIYFPLIILAVAALALRLSHMARRRGWIG